MQYSRFGAIAPQRFILPCIIAVTLAGCDAQVPVSASKAQASSASHGHASMTHSDLPDDVLKRQIARLRDRTERFRRFTAADSAGWGTRITDCFQNAELGGMGFHYGNPGLIDGTVDAMQPELLLYEPQSNGGLAFVAVEYVVPFTAWTKPKPPELYGLSFHRNEAFGLWILHVWHERKNSRGIFADWNPGVSCRYAQ